MKKMEEFVHNAHGTPGGTGDSGITGDLDPIRVLVVDDHAVVRSGLATFLMAYSDLQLAGEASNGVEAVRQCVQLQPDVVLMDLSMPEMDGVDATRLIRT